MPEQVNPHPEQIVELLALLLTCQGHGHDLVNRAIMIGKSNWVGVSDIHWLRNEGWVGGSHV
jgi:hypothetical protein